jgi:hypothetical protein
MIFYPLSVCDLDMSLDWVSDGIGGAIEEELHLVKKDASMKIKGNREVQNKGNA